MNKVKNNEILKKFKKGVDLLADTTKITLGPSGRLVVIDDQYGTVTTKDGVTVARDVETEGFANVGVKLIKEASSKVNKEVGDGTTSVCVLTQAIFNEGFKLVEAGINPILLKREIEENKDILVEELKKQAKPVDNIEFIASVSANDAEMGKLVAKISQEVGENGVINVENSNLPGYTTEIEKAMKLDGGFMSPGFIENRIKGDFKDANIVIFDKELNSLNEIVKLLSYILENKLDNLVIFAKDFSDVILENLLVNSRHNNPKTYLNLVAIKVPYFGESCSKVMEDIAAVSGAKLVTTEFTPEHLGGAESVIISHDYTSIVKGEGNANKRIKLLKSQIKEEKSDFEKDFLKERLARLCGKVGTIKVGASTDQERKEKRHRIDDALCAVNAAKQEGYVVGGGVIWLRLLKKLKDNNGGRILKLALEQPLKQIAENCGKNGDIIVDEVKKLDFNFGYNGITDTTEDLVKAGIIDPVKVVRLTLETAVSIAVILLTTKAVIKKEK